jgi:hypothetical protein
MKNGKKWTKLTKYTLANFEPNVHDLNEDFKNGIS